MQFGLVYLKSQLEVEAFPSLAVCGVWGFKKCKCKGLSLKSSTALGPTITL